MDWRRVSILIYVNRLSRMLGRSQERNVQVCIALYLARVIRRELN